jgi:TolB-like protein/AraC-like DNA-binding protein/Tfp pilus assembly protein PilF
MENEKIQSRDELFLKKVTDAVLNNLKNEQFGVTELSEAVAISRFQLHRKLKLLKGKSVSQFIREIRLSEAMKMLRADAATTSEISYHVGFTSPSYFNKCFRDFYGYSPGEVKKRSTEVSTNLSQEDAERPVIPTELKNVRPASSSKKYLRRLLVFATPIVFAVLLLAYLYSSTKERELAIAILPLDNLTGYPEQAYFVDGMHDALIGELGQISALRVISRTSTLRYQKSEKLIQEIARELGADLIVEGSVYGSGDSVRIQLQLIDAFPKERHVWAKEYHNNIQHALAMHSSVVRDIATEIRVSLTPDEEVRLSQTRTVNPETYRAYLRGIHQIAQFTPEGVEKGMSYLLDAARLDPGDPLLWAGLAIGYNTLGHGPSPPQDAYTNAKAAAKRALALDENLAETHLALAMIALYRDWDWDVAEKEFTRALELNPNLAEAHANYAWFKMLFGQNEETIRHAKKAAELDPFSSINVAYLAAEYWWLGQYEEAVNEVNKALKLMPDYGFALFVKGGTYSSLASHAEAIEVLRQAAGAGQEWRWALASAYVVANNRREAKRLADEIEHNPRPIDTWGLAEVYAALGDKDKAFYWLEECYKVRFSWMPWIACNPNYRSLHDDPRFAELLKRLNLPYMTESLTSR